MLNPRSFPSPGNISVEDSTASFDVYQRHRHVELLELNENQCDIIHME